MIENPVGLRNQVLNDTKDWRPLYHLSVPKQPSCHNTVGHFMKIIITNGRVQVGVDPDRAIDVGADPG